ncbi:putative Synaptobrevin protein [Trachipleistophora hominis]|uniref:Putative Synaptobrevin protein n=1 Tax=Trachipleistophora hominis TaxID=72359 RepID=L7JYD3_TRAHO|nr:putative Synaptobrevin protein [Trachipleistophora hominis]
MGDEITLKINKELLELQDQLKTNIKNEVDRTSKLKKLSKKTEGLEKRGQVFKKKAVEVEQKMWWKSVKYWIVIGVIIFVILLVIYKLFLK